MKSCVKLQQDLALLLTPLDKALCLLQCHTMMIETCRFPQDSVDHTLTAEHELVMWLKLIASALCTSTASHPVYAQLSPLSTASQVRPSNFPSLSPLAELDYIRTLLPERHLLNIDASLFHRLSFCLSQFELSVTALRDWELVIDDLTDPSQLQPSTPHTPDAIRQLVTLPSPHFPTLASKLSSAAASDDELSLPESIPDTPTDDADAYFAHVTMRRTSVGKT